MDYIVLRRTPRKGQWERTNDPIVRFYNIQNLRFKMLLLISETSKLFLVGSPIFVDFNVQF